VCFLLYIQKSEEWMVFNDVQNDIFSNYEMWHLSHMDNYDSISALQMANISIDSLLD